MSFYDNLEERIFEIILGEVKEGENVLEIGCGNCKLITYLVRKRKIEGVGVDIIDFGFKETLKKMDKNLRKRIKCIEEDAGNLKDFKDESFSSIVSKYSLHEFSSPLQILKECFRVLKKGGKIIIVDFLQGTLAERLWNERYFSMEEIREMIERYNFKVLKQRKISAEGPGIVIGIK